MTKQPPSRLIERRQLLRGAGVLGGAGVVAAVSTAIASPAEAADGGDLLIGKKNSEASTTGLTITSGAAPTLALTNTDGPQLNLSAADDFDGTLKVGDVVGTSEGPLIGADFGNGPETTILVTPNDLPYLVPTSVAASERLLDTRTSSGRAQIRRKSSGALNSAGQLVAGHWIDLEVGLTAGYYAGAVYFYLAVLSPSSSGYATVYLPSDGVRPTTASLNFQKGITLGSGGFSGVDTYNDSYVVRIYASATTHLVFDRTGLVFTPNTDGGAGVKTRSRVLTRAARARKGQAGMGRATARR
jgi:hypothetical protein